MTENEILNDCLAAQCDCVRGVIGIPADEEQSETQVLGVPRVFGFTLVPSGRMYPCLSSGAPVHG